MQCTEGIFQRKPPAFGTLLTTKELAGDTTQKGRETSTAGIKRFRVMDEPDENFLGELVGPVCIPGHVQSKLKDSAGMTLIQRGESVTVAALKGREKALV